MRQPGHSLQSHPVPRLVCLLMVCLLPQLASALDPPRGALAIEPEELRPGLLAHYRSRIDKAATLHRIEPKPAFYLGHSSPHPRLPPGPFEVVWKGILEVRDASPLSFHAFVGGEVTVEVDGVVVLQGRGQSDDAEIASKESLKREPGYYRLVVSYRSLASVPARLQLWWQGPGFAREPLPPWRLGHLLADLTPEAQQEQLAEQGRVATGRLGCARCHQTAFPGVSDPPPGPSLADTRRRLDRTWLLHWLKDPGKVRAGARMPALFKDDRQGYAERWIIAEFLTDREKRNQEPSPPAGDHRRGRLQFLGLGCAACHFVPDVDRAEQRDLNRFALTGLADRMSAADLAEFLANPHGRYPDGRMPRLPVTPDAARDITAYLLLWSKPSPEQAGGVAPTRKEIQDVVRGTGTSNQTAAASSLLHAKGCTSCHSGLGSSLPLDVPIKPTATQGCLSGKGMPRYTLDAATGKALAAYLKLATRDRHPSPFATRQQQLERVGCVRCHQRDSDRPPPIEEAGTFLGGAHLQNLPYQRTPRLTYPHQRLMRKYLIATVREGVANLRHGRYSYRMPAFSADAESLVQALAEADGELPTAADPPDRQAADPTVATLTGPRMVGFQGYGCVSCHVWNGELLAPADPGAVGTDLTRVAGRLRRDWFDRFLEDPARSYPATPMPSVFQHGMPATLTSVLDGDPVKQKEALWSYFAQGKKAPTPKPPPPLPIAAPTPTDPPLVGQIPIRLRDGRVVESICLYSGSHDLLIYDLAECTPHSFYTGAQILRTVQGRIRQFLASGTPTGPGLAAESPWQLMAGDRREVPKERVLHGYDRLADGFRLRWQGGFTGGVIKIEETLRFLHEKGKRCLVREFRLTKIPKGSLMEMRSRVPESLTVNVIATTGSVKSSTTDQILATILTPDKNGTVVALQRHDLPPAQSPPEWKSKPVTDTSSMEGSLERPGYRAIAYPRPKTVSGEDRVMPAALAVGPQDGRVFVASLKTGEIFVLHDPEGDGKKARFINYTRGLFQDALSMLAEKDALYVLHRRNLTRIADTDRDGLADRFDRVEGLPHGVVDTYDYAYGLVRDKKGNFVISYAPYANTHLPGSGGAVRLVPGKKPEEIAYGMRNPLGWCVGPAGEIFFTDNQGEWVATNKLCHLAEGRYHGFPNQAQKQHITKPAGKPVIWAPYSWARSINGVTYDHTGGKFGPFAGQFFLAELMFGGAILRANVEKVNGVYQGACFPFWGKGLMGPVTLAFDPQGPLYVGGITEPGWMAQPDRGALFRIDFTGETPFEMQSIHVLPRGFRIVFTKPVDRKSAMNPASYRVDYHRYEYTGAYGSPELDRARLAVERIELSPDGRSVDLITAPLVKDRVYLIEGKGVRSPTGEKLVHPVGAYTLNEIPTEKP